MPDGSFMAEKGAASLSETAPLHLNDHLQRNPYRRDKLLAL